MLILIARNITIHVWLQYTVVYSYIKLSFKKICIIVYKDFLKGTTSFELTVQQALSYFITFFFASFNSIQKINKCQKCIYKCKRSLCYLLWLHSEKPITCFLAKKEKVIGNLLLRLLLELVQSISNDRAERRGIYRIFSHHHP